MSVNGKWIKTGTLVEHEVDGDCPKHKSSKACEDATTSNTRCLWCEKANMCITSNDKDTQDFKVSLCQNKNSLIDVPSEPKVVEEDKTTPATTVTDLRTELKQTTENTETHSNVTTQMNEDKKQGESRNYAYIIVPVVVTFIVICIVCAIGIWFYRKEKSIPCLS
ncbi:unnamed protein product [Schistosoma spindalis]|nr:unnamed protein product [Schistosoma spindale]